MRQIKDFVGSSTLNLAYSCMQAILESSYVQSFLASSFIQGILAAPFVQLVLASSVLRAALAVAGFPLSIVFNSRAAGFASELCTTALAINLLKAAKVAKADFLDGRDADLQEVEKLADQLAAIPEGDLISEDNAGDPGQHNRLLAFWLNVYNALTIHATIRTCRDVGLRYQAHLSVRELLEGYFFKRAAYVVAGRVFTLEDIEHGILRTNRAVPSLMNLGTAGLGQFYPWDDRRRFSLHTFDIRIHFALNCGARSCPAIRAYTPEKVQSQLDDAAKIFFKTGGLKLEGNSVILSPVVMWFSWDFGYTTRSRLAAVLPYVEASLRDDIAAVVECQGLTWGAYDWSFG